jgi:hypothetical protein
MGYQILQDDPTEYEVIEYPSFADERALHRLLVQTDTAIVPQAQKEELCEKWGWDVEEACSEEITDYVDYHVELTRVILKDADGITKDRADQLRPGKIQEARMDFIEGCQGRSGGLDSASRQGLMQAMRSLLGQSEVTTGTEAGASTETR